jgi:hypothetical protein
VGSVGHELALSKRQCRSGACDSDDVCGERQ